MGLYPSQTAFVIRCCVHEREQTADWFPDTSDDERETKSKTDVAVPWLARTLERDVLPRSLSSRTTLPVQ